MPDDPCLPQLGEMVLDAARRDADSLGQESPGDSWLGLEHGQDTFARSGSRRRGRSGHAFLGSIHNLLGSFLGSLWYFLGSFSIRGLPCSPRVGCLVPSRERELDPQPVLGLNPPFGQGTAQLLATCDDPLHAQAPGLDQSCPKKPLPAAQERRGTMNRRRPGMAKGDGRCAARACRTLRLRTLATAGRREAAAPLSLSSERDWAIVER